MSEAEAEPVAATGPTILVVDDEPNLRRVLGAVLQRDGYNVLVASGGREAVRMAKEQPVDLLVTDFLMPDMSGLEVLSAVRGNHPNVRALLISGHGTVRSAVDAMRLGAFDFITKPFDVEQVRATVKRAFEAPDAESPAPAPGAAAAAGVAAGRSGGRTDAAGVGRDLVGGAPATERMKEHLLRAAASRVTVLLLGESGTGKEVAARLLHNASPRKRGPFVAVSCAALPDTLLESELFGHEKSAFTGALAAKPGRFELAHGGTLFLDEIGDIPHITQVKLLRALQEREIARIGGVKTIKVDVRVVAATNRDLWQAVQEGTFRADLYYRLNVVPVALPPLRERREDIRPLAEHFLALAAGENERAFPGGIAPEALRLLEAHDWPGNIRELQNALAHAAVLSDPGAHRIEADALPAAVRQGVAAKPAVLRAVSG
uniref:Response regulator of zinc sigma-54-dependent two-component system n=1 Tax=uncultured Armatimonadetes bacterium TaxID=157466 RepID=A0A6J4IFW2_9BACT|nr:Response regulator of zinc sigma-54-dependent two-component system [uncultured Armatimonadetes bacterium]